MLACLTGVKDLTMDEFNSIRCLVYDSIGVNLTEAKKALVISRLSRRLRELQLDSFGDYIRHLEQNPAEVEVVFNCITTNVTSFFREKHHFAYLESNYLPEFEAAVIENGHPRKKEIRAWSAGCSTGEEPYTLAMTLHNYCRSRKNWEIKIVATDVNTVALAKARRGIYSRKEVEGIPYSFLKTYFQLGTGPNSGLFKVKDTLRRLVSFRPLNLTMPGDYGLSEPLNMIFCRNVFIYFDRETRSRLLQRFYRCLLPGGLLFLGHSESINTADQVGRWRLLQHTIYQKLY